MPTPWFYNSTIDLKLYLIFPLKLSFSAPISRIHSLAWTNGWASSWTSVIETNKKKCKYFTDDMFLSLVTDFWRAHLIKEYVKL